MQPGHVGSAEGEGGSAPLSEPTGGPRATLGWAVREGMRVGMKVSAPVGGGLLVLGAVAATVRGDWSAYGGLALGVLIGLVALPLACASVYGAIYLLLARHEQR